MSKNISNWPDPESKDRILAKIIHFYCIKGILKKKLKTTETNRYALSISPLSTLMRYLRNISNWPDQGGQRCDMSQNYLQHKDNFPSKNRKQEKYTNML